MRQAFAVFGIVAAGGGAVGLLLGGFLTEYLDWRWCLYINLPIAVVAAIGLAMFATLSTFLYFTFFMQVVLAYSALGPAWRSCR